MNFAYLLVLAACFEAVPEEFQTANLDRAVFQPLFDEKPRTATPEVDEPETGEAVKRPESKVAFRKMPIDQVQARLLQWMAPVTAQTFNRCDKAAFRLCYSHKAGTDSFTINFNHARTAIANAAAIFGARQVRRVAQRPQ